jgi:hypothetical protein
VVHLPLIWADGSRARAAWGDAERAFAREVVQARLAAAVETKVDRWCGAIAPDGRAQLAGAVLDQGLAWEEKASVPAMVLDDALLGAWRASSTTIAPGLRCDRTNFQSAFSVFATFSGNAHFESATFSGDAIFHRATFSGDTFFDSATFSGDTFFDSATFSGEARFKSATFSGDASFDIAAFSGDAGFDCATFSGHASFHRATFSGNAHFESATFSGAAIIHRAAFSGYAGFESATFSGFADFDHATFSSHASFVSAIFSGDASFVSAIFSGNAGFDTVCFKQSLYFLAARFDGLTFLGNGLRWPEKAEHWHRAFDKAEFKRTVSFEGSGLHGLAAFDGIRIAMEASLGLDDGSDADAEATFEDELRAALAAASRDAERQYAEQKVKRWLVGQRRAILRDAEDLRLKELERGCRALVVEMEKLRDKTRAQLFYRFEIAARRRQNETSWPEKVVSWLYDKLGDYGAAIGRPLFWLLLSIPLFAAAYGGALWLQRDALCAPHADAQPETHAARVFCAAPRRSEVFWGAMSFSAQRVLPFGAWDVKAEEPEKNDAVRVLLLGEGDTAFSFVVRLVATVQSVFALAMAFLAGIALRRRFQLD